jgi:hypothetical protein
MDKINERDLVIHHRRFLAVPWGARHSKHTGSIARNLRKFILVFFFMAI